MRRIVFTAGTFDIFHVGHVNLLQACRWIAGPEGQVVVGLNGDKFIETYKGEYPINKYMDRYSVVRASVFVDRVVETGSQLIHAIERVFARDNTPERRFLVVGSDWAKKDYYAQTGLTQDYLDFNNIQLIYVPYTEGISSSKLRRHLAD